MFGNWFGHYLNEDSRQNYHRIGNRWFYIASDIKKLFSQWNNYWRYSNLYTFNNNFCNFPTNKIRQFFSFYAGHSEELINIALSAYGNLNFLGSVNEFTFVDAREPSIKHIGLFNSHLREGYPEIQNLKDEAFRISIIHINNIRNIKKDFEARINTIIQTNTDFKDYVKRNNKDISNKYYYPDIILEVFREIRNQNNNISRKLIPITLDNKIIYAYFEQDTTKKLLSNKYEYSKIDDHYQEFKKIIDMLTNDTELRELVNRYNTEVTRFRSIQEGIEFSNFIRQLHENVVNQTNEELNGFCRICKLRKLISI
jgi:hypothetical protein